MLTIRPTTLALLREFAGRGGKVIFCGEKPQYVNAVRSAEPARLSENCICVPFDEDALVSAVRRYTKAMVSVTGPDKRTEKKVFVQVRRAFIGNGYAVVALNTDREAPRRGLELSLRAPGGCMAQEWKFDSGERFDASAITQEADGFYRVRLDLEAGGTRCFVFFREPEELAPLPAYEKVAEKTLTGEFPFVCDEPNVCVLDWCRWRVKDGQWSEEDEALRADRQIRSHFGLEYRGGGMLQPWYAKSFDRKEYGAVQLSYTFDVEKIPASPIFLAGERPELNRYCVNGVPLSERAYGFWVDDCFKKMEIPSGALKVGQNEVTAEVDFKRTTNVEALYLVGDFGVKLNGRSRALVDAPLKMGCCNYASRNMPFFTGNLTFELAPDAYMPVIKDITDCADRIVLTPDRFTGACVRVAAAGRSSVLGWEPYEADVTEAVRNAKTISVTVEGTRANVFGPLHELPKPAEACGPGSFLTEGDRWTDGYSLMDSGLRGFTFKALKKPAQK